MAKFWPIFPSVIEGKKPQGTFSKGPPVILTLAVKIITAYLGPTRLLKIRTFEKKRQHFQWKKLFVRLFPYYRALKNSGNTLQRSIRFSEIYCGYYKGFFLGPKKLLKKQSFEKRQSFQLRRDFGLLFPAVLSNMTYVRKPFFKVHKLFWLLLWNL